MPERAAETPHVEHGYPDGSVLYRHLGRRFARIVRGEGTWLVDEHGRRYLDGCGGAFVASVGHGVREVAEAIGAQAARIAYVNGTAFTNEPAEELARELAELAPPGLDKVLFLSSGSEAVEAALKLARQYFVEIGKPAKRKIVARAPGYHGSTLLALSASARENAKALFGDWLADVRFVPAPYPYRCACASAKDCEVCSGRVLERALLEEGPETVAAFLAEPVGGASTGASVPPPEHYANVRAICDRHDVLFVDDEVLAGAGRTGRWLALEHYGVVPDLVVMGKGIAGGYAALSAVLASRRILDPIARGSGVPKHAQTFANAPLAAAAGLAVVQKIRREGLVARAEELGRVLHRELARLRDEPLVGDVRGLGLLAGIELVADRATRAPWPRAAGLAERATALARDEGLVVWPSTGCAEGPGREGGAGDVLLVAPPYTITEEEIGELVTRLERTLRRARAELAADGRAPAS